MSDPERRRREDYFRSSDPGAAEDGRRREEYFIQRPGGESDGPIVSDEDIFSGAAEAEAPDWGWDNPVGDTIAGLGNTFNLDRLAVRAMTSGQEQRDALAALDRNETRRRDRGYGYAVGKGLGETAAGVAAGGGTLAALPKMSPVLGSAVAGGLSGAGTAALSSAGRSGDPGQALWDAAKGLGTGAVAGAAIPAAGWLGKKMLGGFSGSAQAAGRAAEEMAAVSGRAVPAPDAATQTYVQMLGDLAEQNPDLAQTFVTGGKQAIYKMAQGGNLTDAQMSYLAKLIGAQRSADGNIAQRASGYLLNLLTRASKNVAAKTAGQDLLPSLPAAAARAAYPEPEARSIDDEDPFGGFTDEQLMPSGAGGDTINLGPVNIQAGEGEGPTSYNDILDADSEMGPSPVDDIDNQAMYTAMREAVGSEAVRARPGMHRELSGVMTAWARGKAPSQDQLALLNYKLGEVPGLQWAAINPDRREVT